MSTAKISIKKNVGGNVDFTDWKKCLSPQSEEWIFERAKENDTNICFSYICSKSKLSERAIEKLIYYTSGMYDPTYENQDKYINLTCEIISKCGSKSLQYAVIRDIINRETYLDETFLFKLVDPSYFLLNKMMNKPSRIPSVMFDLLKNGDTEEILDFFKPLIDILVFRNRSSFSSIKSCVKRLNRTNKFNRYSQILKDEVAFDEKTKKEVNIVAFMNPDIEKLIEYLKNIFSKRISDRLDWWALYQYQNLSYEFKEKYKLSFEETSKSRILVSKLVNPLENL